MTTTVQQDASGIKDESKVRDTAIDHKAELWKMVYALRGSMDTAEYKHVVLGLIFLKHVSDAFEAARRDLEKERSDGADPDDPDEYRTKNIFWVPAEARWPRFQALARQQKIGRLIDDAVADIEHENEALADAFPKDYSRATLDKRRLGRLVDLIGSVTGNAESRSIVPERVYEYLLSRFAGAEGKRGGKYYTPRSVACLLVEMLKPYRGSVYDPCCGSSGTLVQSIIFSRAHANGNGDKGTEDGISIYGQESDRAIWRLAKMNLAIRGIDGQVAHADAFCDDPYPDLQADFVMANPPFDTSDWGGQLLQDDVRWKYGVPPKDNANFAWLQHAVHHLAPGGTAGLVLANGSMSSSQSDESGIRKNLVESDLVDCMVALPGQLFHSTQIPACLWLLSRSRDGGELDKHRDRRGEILFIDARRIGEMEDRAHRRLADGDVTRIAYVYHTWRGDAGAEKYADVPGFCKSISLEEVRRRNHILAPGSYVGAEAERRISYPFREKMARLAAQWRDHQAEAQKLDAEIEANLSALGFDRKTESQ